jgi:peptide/nickel transport system permease protein
MWLYPMAAVYPGLMVLTTVITINFLGDGLQEAIDPKS